MTLQQQAVEPLLPQQLPTSLSPAIAATPDYPSRVAKRIIRVIRPMLLVIAPPSVLLMWFLQQDEPIGRLILAMTALICAVAGAWWWQHSILLKKRRNLLAGMLVVTGVLITGTVLWNNSYIDYAKTLTARKEVFRKKLQRYYTPVYGSPAQTKLLPGVLVGVMAGAASMLVLRLRFDTPMTRRRLGGILLVQTLAIGAFAASDGVERLSGHSSQFAPFRDDANLFTDPATALSKYVDVMPKLSWFGQHYPPGSMLFFMVERLWHFSPYGVWVIGLSVSLSTIFIYLTARELSPLPAVHNFAALAYAATSGPLIYATSSTTPLVLLPGAIALWMFFRALRTGSAINAVVLGVMMVAFTLVSLSSFFFACVMGFWALGALMFGMLTWGRTIKVGLICAAASGGLILLLRWKYGFDLFACASVAVTLHHQQAATSGFDSSGSFFMRSTGNLLAFLLNNLPLISVVITGAILSRRSNIRTRADLLIPATVLAILLATCSGKFYLETERIWIFFVPALALGAAIEMARHHDFRGRWDARVILIAMIVFAVTLELGFTHYR